MSFKQEIFIPFHLVDAAGILFFGHVFTLAHQAWELFIQECLHLSWKEWFQNEEWMVPIKQASADYKKGLQAGFPCLIQISILQIRNSSFEVEFLFYQDETLCCRVKTIHVFCSRVSLQKREIPLSIHQLLTHSEASLNFSK